MDPWFFPILGIAVGVGLAFSYLGRSARKEESKKEADFANAPRLTQTGVDLGVALDAVAHSRALNAKGFNERRRVEWRLTFTLWGGLVLLANAITDIKELTKVDTRWILVGVAATTLLHFGWEHFFVVRAAKLNRLQGYYLENIVRRSISDDIKDVEPRDYLSFWAHYWQVVITLLLGLGLYLVAWLTALH